MNEIRAFVGHSFTPGDKDMFTPTDEEVVRKFLDMFEEIARVHSHFSWTHAQRAQSTGIDAKVLSISSGKNVFIGICTKKELVLPKGLRQPKTWWGVGRQKNIESIWKTSDWIIQEIGLAIGRDCKVILLVESGVRSPGGLQGALEYIEFERSAPEKAFRKLLQMISDIAPANTSLVPIRGQTAPETEPEKSEPPDDLDWKTPKPEWEKGDYEFAFHMLTVLDDKPGREQVYRAYLETNEALQGDNKAAWEAFCEYVRIESGNGSLQHLKELTAAHPHCVEAFNYLAAALSFFGQFADAAHYYEIAAGKAKESARRVRLLGRAAEQRVRARAPEAVLLQAINELKNSVQSPNDELDLLSALKNVAEAMKDNQTLIAIMQRIIDVDPSDMKTRFSLAFKHSEVGNDDLSLFHYLKIPPSMREPTTWNNLGVAFNKFELEARSVDAYRRAEAAGETLAMSNLALKFLSEGFLAEARQLCETALTKPECHMNVPLALAQINKEMEKEEKELEAIIEKLRPVNEFYSAYGRGISLLQPTELAKIWTGSECQLEVSLVGSAFTATGAFLKSANQLMGGLGMLGSGLGVIGPQLERWKIEVTGVLRGRSVEARVLRQRVDDQRARSLLSDFVSSEPILLILSDDGNEFQVMERPKEQAAKFYKITRLSASSSNDGPM